MKKNILIACFTATVIFLNLSCKKDGTNDNGTKAVFSYVSDGFIVNFKDYSTNAKEYSWDFGDAGTSTKANPVHIYHSKGEFLAKLTITNGTNTSEFIDTVYVAGPNIKIDGDFTDWTYVDYSHTNEGTTGGTLLAVKTFASAAALNFYVEGTEDLNLTLIDLLIDADNNTATGFQFWMYPIASGADFLCEGSPVGGWGSGYTHAGGDNNGWTWESAFDFDGTIKFSEIKEVDGKKVVEFSIKRSALGVQKDFVNFALQELDAGYTIVGTIPAAAESTSAFAKIKL
ncbi:MAG: PKD domain-containing protein [Flavitalea sp.]